MLGSVCWKFCVLKCDEPFIFDQVLTKQKVEEEMRRKEMDLLFTEEARKMWDKQEALWEKEKEARKKLMQDVINTLGKQTSEKIRREYNT